MNCILKNHEQEELLLGYCTATLEPEVARTYERHIQGCEECRSMFELQQVADSALNDWQAPEVSMDFDRKLFARIHAEDAKANTWWSWLFPAGVGGWSWKPAVPLALAALVLTIFFLRSPETSAVAQNDGLKADEIEQVELALDDMEALQALHQSDAESAPKEAL